MRDELYGRMWADHHEQFSQSVSVGLARFGKAAARVLDVPYLAERAAAQFVLACLAVSVGVTVTVGTGLA